MNFLANIDTNGWIALSLVAICGAMLLILASAKLFKNQLSKRSESFVIRDLSPASQAQGILVHHLIPLSPPSSHLQQSYESFVNQSTTNRDSPKSCNFIPGSLIECFVSQTTDHKHAIFNKYEDLSKSLTCLSHSHSIKTPLKRQMVACLPSHINDSLLWYTLPQDHITLNNRNAENHEIPKWLNLKQVQTTPLFPQVPAPKLPRKKKTDNKVRNGLGARGYSIPLKKPNMCDKGQKGGTSSNANGSNMNNGGNNFCSRLKGSSTTLLQYGKSSLKMLDKTLPVLRETALEYLGSPKRKGATNEVTIINEPEGSCWQPCMANSTLLEELTDAPLGSGKNLFRHVYNNGTAYTAQIPKRNGIVHLRLNFQHGTKIMKVNIAKISGINLGVLMDALHHTDKQKSSSPTLFQPRDNCPSGSNSPTYLSHPNGGLSYAAQKEADVDALEKDIGPVQVYIEFEFLPERPQVLQTRQISKTIHDLVNHSLDIDEEFTVFKDVDTDVILEASLLLKVIILRSPRDYREREVVLGETHLPLNDISQEFIGKSADICQELHPLLFPNPNMSPVVFEHPQLKHKVYRGELYVCLCYNSNDDTLEFSILKVKNLNTINKTGLIEPHLKVCLKNEHGTCLSKYSTRIRDKTSGSISSNYHVFKLRYPPIVVDSAGHSELQENDISHFRLECTLTEWNKDDEKEKKSGNVRYNIIGKCTIGCMSMMHSTGRVSPLMYRDYHLSDSFENPMKRVPRWHKLWI